MALAEYAESSPITTGEPVTTDDLEAIALKELWAKDLIYCDIEGSAIEQDGTLLLLDECGSCAYPLEGMFRVVFNKHPAALGPARLATLPLYH
jgi:hypothetical protein